MTSNSGHWTRDDLPSVIKWKSYAGMYLSRLRELEEYVDATLDHLNAHYPKPEPYDQGGVRGADSLLYRAERERDAAVARAEAAENARDTAATRAEQLEKTLAGSRDAHQRSADAYMKWKARAERAERVADSLHKILKTQQGRVAAVEKGQSAPVVTRDDIGNALMRVGVSNSLETHVEVSRGTDAVWALVSGDDPAVYVVRESDIAAVNVEKRENVGWYTDWGGFTAGSEHAAEHSRNQASQFLKRVAEHEAVARAIEAEAVVDPVEAKAQELWEVAKPSADATWSGTNELAKEQFRKVAAHVLGQEADDE